MHSCGPLHMDEQRQDDQLERTYRSSVPIRHVALRTCRKQWKIGRGGDRGLGISMLIVRHDDDNTYTHTHTHTHTHTYIYICIYMYVCMCTCVCVNKWEKTIAWKRWIKQPCLLLNLHLRLIIVSGQESLPFITEHSSCALRYP